MAFVLAPAIAELLSSIGLLATEAAVEVGLSEATASTITKGLIGAASAKAASGTEESITELIGREKVEKAKGNINEILAESVAAFTQDESYFINKAHERIKDTIDFNKEDPSKYHTGKTDPIKTNFNFSEGQQTVSTAAGIKKVGPKEIANFLVSYSSELANQVLDGKVDKVAAAIKVVNDNPEVNTDVLNTLSPFLKARVPNTELYNKISSVYNGQGLSIQNSITARRDPKSKLLYFILKDEIGTLSTLYQTTGIVLPAYPGTVFMGPRSPNNAMPTGITDLFCAFHDQSYENGPNLEGDYKLISRCAQQYSTMDQFNQKLARICITYFGTLGSAVSSLLGSAPSDIPKVVSQLEITDDIYSAIEPAQSVNNPIEHYNKRTEFYATLFDEIENLSRTSSVIAQSGYNTNRFLAQEFGDIIISIN